MPATFRLFSLSLYYTLDPENRVICGTPRTIQVSNNFVDIRSAFLEEIKFIESHGVAETLSVHELPVENKVCHLEVHEFDVHVDDQGNIAKTNFNVKIASDDYYD